MKPTKLKLMLGGSFLIYAGYPGVLTLISAGKLSFLGALLFTVFLIGVVLFAVGFFVKAGDSKLCRGIKWMALGFHIFVIGYQMFWIDTHWGPAHYTYSGIFLFGLLLFFIGTLIPAKKE